MYTTVASRDWAEKLIIETAIIMLSSPEPNIAYGNERAWEYINTHLMGENDKKACLHVLKGEARKLARLGTNGIRIGSEGSKELCSLLCNIEPNAGDEAINQGKKGNNSGIIPRMERFHGPVKKGYGFLQSFKAMAEGMTDGRKIQVFSGLLEKEALSWFLGTKFHSWKELEEEFLQTWCVVMTSTNAIVDVAKIFQKENKYIWIYALLLTMTR